MDLPNIFYFLTRAKVQLLIEDDTGEMELIVFGNRIEKLTGAIFSKLLELSQMDRMNIPGPVSALKNQTRRIEVALTNKAIKIGMIKYRLVDCNESPIEKRRDEARNSNNTI